MEPGQLKITIASSGLGHVARGIEAWAADLARELDVRGLEVTLCKGGGVAEHAYERVLPCRQRGAPATQRLLRMIPRWLGWRLGIGSDYGIEQMTFALNLLQHLWHNNVDILHVQDPQVALVVQRANQLGWVRTRTILSHGTEEPLSFIRKIQYLQHLAPWHEQQARTAGVWKPTWAAIPNFIDTGRFRPAPAERRQMRGELAIPENALVVLTVAAMKRRHKRIDHLLDEFARLRTHSPELPVWLVIAGGWEKETDELIARGREMLGERARFLVRFPRERMPQLYSAADVFVLASLKEMMPIAVLEAMASGVPCLVNRHPVLQWMVGPGGEAADMAVKGELARAMEGILVDPARRRQLGQRAREHCVEAFGKEPVVDRIVAYYRSVAGDEEDAEGGARAQRVSVIIPTFNSAGMVLEAVESVLGQTVPADEIIVVDDGSTDETAEVLAPYFDRIRYLKQENQGVAAARNRGIAEATGDLIAFLDADDVWHSRKLELQVRVISERPEVGMVGTRIFDWPGAVSEMKYKQNQIYSRVAWWELVVRNRFTASSVMVRRALLEKVGPFDEQLQGPEDLDLWLRIAEVAEVGNLRAALTGYRAVAGSLSQRAVTMEAGVRRILRKLEERGAWRGRSLLRHKAHSYCDFSSAYLYAAAGRPAVAMKRLLGSLAKYPLPYRAGDVRMPLARARLLLALVRRLMSGPESEVGNT